jgi:bla regulator protein BlaR1
VTISLMLCSVLIGTVLALAAMLLHSQERAANRPVRWIWMAMIVSTVVLTVVVALRGNRATETLAALPSGLGDSRLLSVPHVQQGGASRVVRALRAAAALPSAAVTATLAHAAGMLSRVPPSVQRGAAVAWCAASVLCIGLLLGVYRRVRRAASGWPSERMLDMKVRVSPDAGPAVIGLRPMEIVVPAWILARPDQEQRLVLQHEQEHIHARDPLLLVTACVAVALMPWNPLLWLGLSRLRLAVEIDCDRRVLRGGTTPNRYARLLLDLSGHPSQLATSLPALSYSASHLERRLLAMTARPARYPLPRRLAGGAVAGLLVLAACESRMPTSADVENMDARKAVVTAGALPGLDTAHATYMVDGREVARSVAEGIVSGRIASIEVVKGEARSSQIRLRTVTGGVDTAASPRGSATRLRSKSSFDGLYFLDGKQVSDTVANSLDPNRIESIEVVKGAAASMRYSDPRAAHGVIVIRTKTP